MKTIKEVLNSLASVSYIFGIDGESLDTTRLEDSALEELEKIINEIIGRDEEPGQLEVDVYAVPDGVKEMTMPRAPKAFYTNGLRWEQRERLSELLGGKK